MSFNNRVSQVYDKNRAFKFLEHIKNKFESQYQRRVHTALPVNIIFRILYHLVQL
jgi:hypothetical protein